MFIMQGVQDKNKRSYSLGSVRTLGMCLLVIFNTINRLPLRGDTFNRFYFLA